MKLIGECEKGLGCTCLEVRLFDDGSGTINEYGMELYEFESLQELIKYLNTHK